MYRLEVIKSGDQVLLRSEESGIILRLSMHSDSIIEMNYHTAIMDEYDKGFLQSIVNETLNPDVIQIVEL